MDTKGRDAILVVGGAFNPVHTQHVAILKLAKEYLETHHHVNVVGAYLAAAPDGYVKQKMEKKERKAIKGIHRIAMCNLAIEGLEWIKPSDRTYGSAQLCATQMRTNTETDIYIVVGADRAMSKNQSSAKWRKQVKDETVKTLCIGRPGETEKVKMLYNQDLERGLVKSSFIFMETETTPVSSTIVREHLLEMHQATGKDTKRNILEYIITEGMIVPFVAQYILENENDLYL